MKKNTSRARVEFAFWGKYLTKKLDKEWSSDLSPKSPSPNREYVCRASTDVEARGFHSAF